MNIEISEAPITAVMELARVPIAFNVDRVFDVAAQDHDVGGFVLSERRLDVSYVKDYDAIDGEGPTQWAQRFEISDWGLIMAHSTGRLVGGAVMAFNSVGVSMLEGRKDLTVLWDIRVSPEVRGQGVGSGLFRAAEVWSIERGCRRLKVETQNINVPACRFYARQDVCLERFTDLPIPSFRTRSSSFGPKISVHPRSDLQILRPTNTRLHPSAAANC